MPTITTFQQDLSAQFPAGTSLEVRPASNWPAHKRPPEAGTAPLGAATDTAVSNGTGVVAFDGLTDSTEYFVSDAAGTRYVRITTFPERQEVMTNQGDAANGYVKADASGLLDPSRIHGTADGDMLVRSGGSFAVLAKGSTGQAIIVRSDGTIAYASPPTAYLKAWGAGEGGDDRAKIQSAVDAIGTFGRVVGEHGKTYLLNTSTAVKFPSGATWIGFDGNWATFKCSATVPQAFGFKDVAADETYQNIDFGRLVVDRDNVAGDTIAAIGSTLAHKNFSNVHVHDVITKNVPTDTTGATQPRNIYFLVSHTTGADAVQNSLTDITVERCNLSGGNYGVVIGANSPGPGANVFYDRLKVLDVRHDTGVTPAGSAGSANFQIGVGAFGGSIQIERCYGKGALDVGVEIDQPTDCTIRSTTIEDACVGAFFWTRFRASADDNSQRILLDDCHVKVSAALDPQNATTRKAYGFRSTTATAWMRAILRNCSYTSKAAKWDVAGQAVSVHDANVRELVIDGFSVTRDAINHGTGGSPVEIDVRLSANESRCLISRAIWWQAGTASSSVVPTFIRVSGGSAGAETYIAIEKIGVKATATNITAGNTIYVKLGAEAGKLRGSVRDAYVIGNSGDTAPKMVEVGGTGTLTIDDVLRLENITPGPNAVAGTVQASFAGASNAGSVEMREIGSPAPVTVASATTTTLPLAGDLFTISGTTTITSVTASWAGRRVTLVFSGILTFTDGSNLKLAGNFVTTADDSITLVSDGTNWIETSRSVN